ncbi:MAG: YdcF family protein [Chloroflexi bacterium]|nr:YdcF family protein [Chloroflexota bacterium]
MFRVFLAIVVVALFWLSIHTALTILIGVNAQPRPSDVAIVLGNRVERSGIPSGPLRLRLDQALVLYRQGIVKTIIVSGGLGREGYEEADVMRDYLNQRGVPAENIFTDRGGYDTYETARNAKRMMDARGFSSAVIVSHYFHLPRALVTFKRFGVANVSASAVQRAPSFRDTYNVLREFAAFYFYLLRDYAAT